MSQRIYHWEAVVTKKLFDVDEAILAEAQRQLGTATGKDTVNLALATVAGLKAKEREAAFDYLREHFDELFDLSAVDPKKLRFPQPPAAA
jgi:Arc/MetJ family transcription regulator